MSVLNIMNKKYDVSLRSLKKKRTSNKYWHNEQTKSNNWSTQIHETLVYQYQQKSSIKFGQTL